MATPKTVLKGTNMPCYYGVEVDGVLVGDVFQWGVKRYLPNTWWYRSARDWKIRDRSMTGAQGPYFQRQQAVAALKESLSSTEPPTKEGRSDMMPETDTTPRPAPPATPQCDKLAKHSDDIDTVREFLDWVQDDQHLVMVSRERLETLRQMAACYQALIQSPGPRSRNEEPFDESAAGMTTVGTETLIDGFFHLDQKAIEAERRVLLAYVRGRHQDVPVKGDVL